MLNCPECDAVEVLLKSFRQKTFIVHGPGKEGNQRSTSSAGGNVCRQDDVRSTTGAQASLTHREACLLKGFRV